MAGNLKSTDIAGQGNALLRFLLVDSLMYGIDRYLGYLRLSR